MSPPSSSRSDWPFDSSKDTKSQLAQRIFHSLVQDVLCNLAISTHQTEARKRAQSSPDEPDGSPTRTDHHGSSQSARDSATTLEDGEVPQPSTISKTSSSHGTTATDVPGSTINSSGGGGPSSSALATATTAYANPLIRCMVCNRHVSSNRFAPHLAKCMGLGSTGVGGSSSSKTGAHGGLKRKAAVGAATAAALAAQSSSASGLPTGKRGRPPKSRGGTGSARSTATPVPGLGTKEGSAAP